MFSENSEKIYITIAAFLTVFLINYVFSLHAWNPPTATPTGGNIELLNVGSATQFKTGALGLGGNSKTSGIKINSGGATEPTCNVNTRGLFWSKSGGESEKDELIVCLKNSDDEYAWEFVSFWECAEFDEACSIDGDCCAGNICKSWGVCQPIGEIADACVVNADCGESPYEDVGLVCDSYDDTCRVQADSLCEFNDDCQYGFSGRSCIGYCDL